MLTIFKFSCPQLYFITTKQFARVMFQIKSMRTAYRKIFMCVDANAGSLEERLAEVVLFVFVYFFEVVGDLSSVFLGVDLILWETYSAGAA